MTHAKHIPAPVAALALLLVGGLAFAQQAAAQSTPSQPANVTPPGGPAAGEDVRRLHRTMENLNLSESQKYQLQNLAEYHRTSTAGLREQIRSAQETIAQTRREDPNYAATTAQARQTIDSARSQLQAQRQQFETNARALLTAEQLNTLEAQRAERRQRMSERREEWKERRSERGEGRRAMPGGERRGLPGGRGPGSRGPGG